MGALSLHRQLALQRGLQGRWEEAVRLDPLPLLVTLRGKALYVKGDYTVAIEVLRDACRSAADAGYPHLMLSCRLWMGNCYSDLGRMEEMLAHFAVAERLAEALGDTDSLGSLRYNIAATQLELVQPEKGPALFFCPPAPQPSGPAQACHLPRAAWAPGAGADSRSTGRAPVLR